MACALLRGSQGCSWLLARGGHGSTHCCGKGHPVWSRHQSTSSTGYGPLQLALPVARAAAGAAQYEWDDVLAASMLFEALGVGLGRTAMMDVARAAQRLGEDPARRVATVRFFGKFLGLNDDYYVFETTLQEPSVEQLEPEMLGGAGQAHSRAAWRLPAPQRTCGEQLWSGNAGRGRLNMPSRTGTQSAT
jgi:hypothetical protein